MNIFRKVAFVLIGFSVVACQAVPAAPTATATRSGEVTPAVEGTATEPAPQPVSGGGVLKGSVKIGPLSPVERQGETQPAPAPEVFTSRGIAVYQVDGKTLVTHSSFKEDGTYQVELPAGSYIIDLYPKTKMDRAAPLPKQVKIFAGEITILDIEIDTGIR